MLSSVARRAAGDFGDRAAFVEQDGHRISYCELDRAADVVATGLVRHDVTKSSVVALVMGSTIDYVVTYLAAARVGAVSAGINPRFTASESAACLSLLNPDLIVTAELATELRHSESSEPLAFDPSTTADPDQPVCICFTSGSTGSPKGAWFTNRQLEAIAQLDTGGAWGDGGHGLSSTQFAHVGFMTKLPWMLASGRTTHLLERWSSSKVLTLIAEHRMGAVTGVAPQIALMLRDPLIAQLDFESVRAIVVGGAASPPALVTEARERFGAPYSIRYSSTESGGIGLGTGLDATDDEALFTIGRPRPGVEVQIRDTQLRPLAESDQSVGELWLRSPAVMSGYWNDDAATAEALVDGWLRTGDLARRDPTGTVRLAGRVKEMFIRGGYNVYPMEVEATLGQHTSVQEIAIVARPDPVMGEIGVATVVPADPGDPPTLEDLRRFGAETLAHYKLPEAIRIVDELPRNASDKVDRRALAIGDH